MAGSIHAVTLAVVKISGSESGDLVGSNFESTMKPEII